MVAVDSCAFAMLVGIDELAMHFFEPTPDSWLRSLEFTGVALSDLG
jgi:hypothetical protein